MVISHDREKLIHSINFFARHTRKCGKVKLYKLLYFLDFEHFKLTGRSVTGLYYNAWPMGPVPVTLHDEIDAPAADMAAIVGFEKKSIRAGAQEMLAVTPRADFSEQHFSRRELSILSDLAARYRDAKADDMIEATHLENLPWHKVYNQAGARQARIPYDLALRADERDKMRRIVAEREELLGRLG